MRDLQELPRFGDKLSYLYVEHAAIDQEDKSIALHQADGHTAVSAAALAVLLLGPGTSITHAAIRALADNNCLLLWVGEHGVRFYAQGMGGARHSRNLLQQARLASDPHTRLQVVVRMYCRRFAESIDPGLTLQQLRGREGIRVREAYAQASRDTGVPWTGRSYRRDDWASADPVNRALSCANSCLYGLCHAAILSGGYSPAIGFIHTGKQLSFVYDIADLYKAQTTIPTAFQIARDQPPDLERATRLACREQFRATRLMERILPDIGTVLEIGAAAGDEQAQDEFADDAARPAELWEPPGAATMPIGQILRQPREKEPHP